MFDIPFATVQSDINTRGTLWQSIHSAASQLALSVQNRDIAKIQSLGFQPYSVTPTDTEQLQGFAAAGTNSAQTLYAFTASKGANDEGYLFFFLDDHYLGTDTWKEHALNLSMYPDGKGTIVVQYENTQPNGTSDPFTMRFTWTGSKLLLSRSFPADFT